MSITKSDIKKLELYQKKLLKWMTGKNNSGYATQLKKLNLLPLTMFMQLNDILLLRKLYFEDNSSDQPDVVISLKKTENARGGFVIRTCRVLNKFIFTSTYWTQTD